MRLVISSDNHIDVNRLDLTTTLQFSELASSTSG